MQGHATYVACGLKCFVDYGFLRVFASCHVCGMWIEIVYLDYTGRRRVRHATYVACGLKFSDGGIKCEGIYRHATYVACGLK